MEITRLNISQTRAAVAEGRLTATGLVEAFFKKIKAEDGEIHAWLTLSEERAYAQARRMDRLAADGGIPLPPMAGVPVGIKDVMVTSGVRT
ncbi:MAG TPA: amidase family protein, partial [Candidatus Angelobacter sp.]|nr:amidase family protein [Candidatus Angelobacter sp.]